MTPILVSAPSDLVTLDEVKAHLRVDHDDDDPMIGQHILAAIGYLDGYRGILGRAMKSQVWRETFTGSGPYRLSMPDVGEVTVTADDVVVDGVLTVDCRGPLVTITGSADATSIEYECGMGADHIAVAKVAVMLYVSHLYDRTDLSPAFHSLVSALRWRGV